MPSPKPEPASQKKVERYRKYDVTDLSDLIACMAANIEDAYRTAGVADYTAKECVDLAAKAAIDAYMRGYAMEKVEFRVQTG